MRPYVTTLNMTQDRFSRISTKKFELVHFLEWSGRQDSNLRPPVPKTGALPGCATPRLVVVLNKE